MEVRESFHMRDTVLERGSRGEVIACCGAGMRGKMTRQSTESLCMKK